MVENVVRIVEYFVEKLVRIIEIMLEKGDNNLFMKKENFVENAPSVEKRIIFGRSVVSVLMVESSCYSGCYSRVNGQSRIPWAQCKQMVANLLVEYFWKKGNLTSHLQHARATPPNSSSLAHTSPFDFLMKCPSSCFRNFAFNDFKLPQLLFDETILRNFNVKCQRYPINFGKAIAAPTEKCCCHHPFSCCSC
uniref:Uncharacterized protein n=1 Tax=Panagrolaimus sp. JU765 TaxID=591449 RepID=A0AC34QZB8_9BILA